MPTDLDAAVSARKRAEQAQVQTEITILISLSVFALLFEVVLRSG